MPLKNLRLNFKLILAVGVVSTLITFLFPETYLGDCLGNFPVQLILALLVGLLGCLRFHFILCLLAVSSGIYLNMMRIQDAIRSNSKESTNSQCSEIKVGSFNLLSKNGDYESVQKEIEEQKLDVILFQELTPKWEEGLKSTLVKFPDKIVDLRTDDFGSGIFSRHPILSKGKQNLVRGDAGVLTVTLNHCGKLVSIANIHTLPPASINQWRIRNQQIMRVADIVKSDGQWIVMGDFNLTPFSNLYSEFKSVTGLNDARTVLGLLPSWPTWIPPLWIPIDQVFYSSELELVNIQKGRFIGSDHWPIIATFR